ncbi:AI-2E family transporter [Paracoccus benzoatiresistens]|uniref:AI-2E family transporter n=1 Tax=Paracoccus benzoatiresistens TaxID=2997341 RepID=A0ABT4J012_9RHOB|nr:AI-2E family transporter [Paracoccus sp. EF6]MCZ0960456.1 AI-2E family transporter [Paracoccus sp. EF6]
MAAKQFSFPRFRSEGSGASGRAANWAVIGIFLILAFAAIAAGRDFLMPVTLAGLLFFVFTPLRRLARRSGIPDALTAAIVTLGLVVAVALIAFAASGPIHQAANNLPTISVKLEQKLHEVRQSIQQFQEAAEKIEEVQEGGPDGAAAPPIKVEEAGDSPLESLIRFTPAIAGQVIFTLFLLFFMLASGDLLYLKIVQSFDLLSDKRSAYLALRQIEDSLGNYLGAITIINAGLGLAIGLAMFAWGMPGALLFGLGAFVLNYIPYLGAITGIILSGVVALVIMPGLFWPMMVAGTYMLLTALEGQVITPYFVSRRLQMNTVVVFLAVALWAWLWSVIGMIIAVPVLVVLRVLADYVPGWEKFGNFLAGEDPPAIEDEDEEEAREIVEAGDEAQDEGAARQATATVGTSEKVKT